MTAPWAKAYDDKIDTINWLKSRAGSKWVWSMMSEINEGVVMGEDPLRDPYAQDPGWIEAMEGLYSLGSGLAEELSDAETYWVSPDMTQLIGVAVHHKGFDMDQPLRPEDLPSPSGMVFFEHPMDDSIAKIDAISWYPSSRDGIQINIWIKTERWRLRHERVAAEKGVAPFTSEAVSKVVGSGDWLPKNRYMPVDNHDWPFGDPASSLLFISPEEGGIEPSQGTKELLLEARRWIYGAVLMMGQKIALPHSERLPRSTIKRGVRAGLPDTSEIRCITLRREQIDPGGRYFGDSGSINYSHRFMVSGHWKPQWYPSLGEHRMIYIAPYIKGPEDKPLVLKDTVYALRR